MSVAENQGWSLEWALQNISMNEIMLWSAWFALKREEEEKQRKKNKAKQGKGKSGGNKKTEVI